MSQALKSLGAVILTILTLGAASSRRRKQPGRVTQAFSIFAFSVAGAALVALGWWYVTTLYDAVWGPRQVYVLGGVEVVGSDLAETYKKILPRLIVARMTSLRNEANDAILSLKERRARRAEEFRPQTQDLVSELDLPQVFAEPVTIELKIADVDVGSVLSFLTDQSAFKNSLEITASLNKDAGVANVYGHLPGAQGYSFTEETKPTPDDIANTVAAAVIAQVVKREEPALAALGAKAYGTVLSVLSRYANHKKAAPLLGEGSREEFEKLNTDLRDTALRFSRWRDLQWLAAEIAEEARNWNDAKLYYANLAAITPRNHADREQIESQARKVEAEIQKIQVANVKAKSRGVAVKDVLDEEQKSRREAAAEPVARKDANPIWKLLGLDAPGDAAGQVIGVVGSPWQESLTGVDWESLGEIPETDRPELRDYVTEVVQAIRLIAKDATFVFAPNPPLASASALTERLTALTQYPGMGVLFFPYGFGIQDPRIDQTMKAIAAAYPLVLPAGNQSGDSGFGGVADIAIVAGAVTPDGAPAPFSDKADGMVWAPGADIPIVSPQTGSEASRSGTAFSSAIAAGAVAVLRKHFPQAAPAVLLAALRESAQPAEGRDAPPIINIPAALKYLEQKTSATATQG